MYNNNNNSCDTILLFLCFAITIFMMMMSHSHEATEVLTNMVCMYMKLADYKNNNAEYAQINSFNER